MRIEDDRETGEEREKRPDEMKNEEEVHEDAEPVDDKADADGGLEDAEKHEADAAREERRYSCDEVGYGVIAPYLEKPKPDEDERERPTQKHDELVFIGGLHERHFLHRPIIS